MEGNLALVYFGWNDHWLANGAPDSKLIAVQAELGPLERLVRFAHERSRLMQLLVRLQVDLRRRGDPVSAQLRVRHKVLVTVNIERLDSHPISGKKKLLGP